VNSSARPYLEKPFTKTGLVEWLKVKALCSSHRTAKKKKRLGKNIYVKDENIYERMRTSCLQSKPSMT
jgi:hypothetical protein